MSKIDYMLSVDFEMLCWSDEEIAQGLAGFPEIVNIGICETDINFNIRRKLNYLIKPTQKPSQFFIDLTGITPKMLKSAESWDIVLNRLKKIGTKNKPWISWGKDHIAMNRFCEFKNTENPFSERHTDLGLIYSFFFGEGKALGMYKTMEKFGISATGTIHRGDDDAENMVYLIKFLKEKMNLNLENKEISNNTAKI